MRCKYDAKKTKQKNKQNKPMNAGKTLERLNAGRLKSLWERKRVETVAYGHFGCPRMKKMLIDTPPIRFVSISLQFPSALSTLNPHIPHDIIPHRVPI
jgi:hypothetical protein